MNWKDSVKRIFLLGIAIFCVRTDGWAGPVRVSTWSFQNSGTNQNPIEAAANALTQQDPDFILLQGVQDWRMCHQLAQALNPGVYSVLGCSSFSDPSGKPPPFGQVAILSKHKAYFFWSEPWGKADIEGLPGGFAFAAVQAGNRRLGIFSVQLDPQQLAQAKTGAKSNLVSHAIQQWMHTFEMLRNWDTNRIEAAVVAGSPAYRSVGRPAKVLARESSLVANFLATPLTRSILQPGLGNDAAWTNYFPAHFVPGLEGLSGVVLAHSATCDLDFNGVMPPTVAAEASGQVSPQTGTLVREPATNPWWMAGISGGLVAMIAVAWALIRGGKRQRQSSRELIAEYAQDRLPASFTVTVAPHSTTGSGSAGAGSGPRPLLNIEAPRSTRTQSEVLPARGLSKANLHEHHAEVSAGLVSILSQWLKQKLVRRLIEDRAKLVATQQASTLKVMNVDVRLARIETQIREQNRAYEQRIEKLNEELSTAKEENRELIRAQIHRVKAEMEAARARLVAETKEQE